MYKRLFTVLAAVALIFSVALSGQKARGPYRITGDEPAKSVATSPGNPAPFGACGPGEEICFTYYDYGTNGSACRNIVNFGDGQLSVGRMASANTIADGTTLRGSYFKFFDGTSWSTGCDRVETVRRGWSNIDQIADAGGVEAVLTHVTEVNIDAARGADVWSSTIVPCAEGTWPRLAIGNGFTIHVIATSGPTVYGYSYSPDAGATWICDAILYTETGVFPDADAYDITAEGDKVAFVLAGQGGDVDVLESIDGGATWTETLIYDIDQSLLTPGEEVPDGSCSLLYDSNGNLHVAWGNYESMGDGATLLYSVNAGIRHWSSGTGVIVEAAFPDPDPTIVAPIGRDGNLASQPDISADASGNVHIVFSRFINEIDANLNYYEHVFAVSSADGGATWSGASDLTPGTGFDASFPSVADLADPLYLHIVYNCDNYAGNALQGTHVNDVVSVRYLMAQTTGVEPVAGVIPSAYQLGQNYPNPFNPTTNIQYSLPRSSFVTLKVYDVLGREVATLVNQEQVAGSYVADFDAATLANGTYYYKLQAGDFTQTRKMMLVK